MRRAPSSTNAAFLKSLNSSRFSKNKPEIPGYQCVGRVADAHGIKGELYIRTFSGAFDWLDELEGGLLMRETDSVQKSFTPILKRPHKEGFILRTKEILDRNEAELWRKAWFLIPEELLLSREGEVIYLKEIQDFLIFDEVLGEVGRVEGFSSNGMQDLIVTHYRGEQREIPFVADFVIRIDFKEKKIHMKLPEGLLADE